MLRLLVLALGISVIQLVGCHSRSSTSSQGESNARVRSNQSPPGQAQATREPSRSDQDRRRVRQPRTSLEISSARSSMAGGNQHMLSSAEATERVLAIVQDAIEFARLWWFG